MIPVAANDGEHPVTEVFPGITAPQTSGAPGSAGDRSSPGTVPLTGSSGLPGVGTVMPVGSQADPGTGTVNQPGQTAESVISPGPAQDYADTGAGGGRARVDSGRRFDWQQSPGGQ